MEQLNHQWGSLKPETSGGFGFPDVISNRISVCEAKCHHRLCDIDRIHAKCVFA